MSKADQFRCDLEATLASLPIVGTVEPSAIERRARQLVEHELRTGLQSATIEGLSEEQRAILRNRCLYYACQDLVTILAHKRIRGDVIAREEAVLYVQDRLQRDDFRRIGTFDPENRATFKTYIWHVINNLLIDFSRARAARSPRDDGAAQTSSADAESTVTDAQMRELVAEALLEDPGSISTMRGLRQQLREHLRLTSSERLFLKALFQFDMSIEEVRRPPTFEMGKSEAWRFYYDLMDRLLEAFKEAGVLGTMRALVSESELRVTVSIAARQVSLAVTKIYCVKQGDADSARCHASWQGNTVLGVIEESFPKLKKQLAPWFTAVNPTTLVSDELLAAASEAWSGEPPRVFTIAGVAEEFPISRSQFAALRRRFAAKTGR